jgi:hypothetical protein
VWLSSPALRRCPCPTRDACDRFLPSAASISSTRASFALDEVTPRSNGILRFRPRRPPCRVCDRAPSGFTPPRWLWRVDVCFFASIAVACCSTATIADRSSVMPVAPRGCAGLRIPSQRPTHPALCRDRSASRPVKASRLRDRTRLPSMRCISRPMPYDTCRT